VSEIEGAVCDECGQVVGPMGCCATARARTEAVAALAADRDRLAAEVERLREELRLNTAMLARQTDLAREAENRLAAAEALGRELAVMANIPGTSCVGECEKCQWNDASGDCGERRDKLLARARTAGWLEEGE